MPELLPGDYIAGLVDGEGHFGLNYRREIKYKRKGQPVYERWSPVFAINLHNSDQEILEQIKVTLQCGNVFLEAAKPVALFEVQDLNDLVKKIIPFFETYSLHAKKKKDFEFWKEAAMVLYQAKKKEMGNYS